MSTIPAPSRYQRVAKSARVTDLLADRPDYAEAVSRLERLQQTASLPAPGEPVDRLIDAILSNDGTVPEDFLTLAGQALAAGSAWNVANEALAGAQRVLSEQLDDVLEGEWDVILGKLHAELTDAVDEAKAFTDLSDLIDGDSAIAADRVQDYQRWSALLSRHHDIRATQNALLQSGDDEDLPYREGAFIRNVEKVFKHWADWRRHGYLVNKRDITDRKPLSPPWPLDPSANPVRLTSAQVSTSDFLTWAIRNGADLWVPTREQLADEQARLTGLALPQPVRQPADRAVDVSHPEPEYDAPPPAGKVKRSSAYGLAELGQAL